MATYSQADGTKILIFEAYQLSNTTVTVFTVPENETYSIQLESSTGSQQIATTFQYIKEYSIAQHGSSSAITSTKVKLDKTGVAGNHEIDTSLGSYYPGEKLKITCAQNFSYRIVVIATVHNG